MSKKPKWYVVWNGYATGVFDSWEECSLQVKGYSCARYRSYPTKEAAIEAYRGDPDAEMGILRSIAKHPVAPVINYSDHPEIILNSIAVDASCLGNPGIMEYRGVWVASGEELFRKGPFKEGTNNIGEFIAIVHALALTQNSETPITIYSDSRTALSWVAKRKVRTTLQRNAVNAPLMDILARAERWIQTHDFRNPILKWDTVHWGEIPADFGRK